MAYIAQEPAGGGPAAKPETELLERDGFEAMPMVEIDPYYVVTDEGKAFRFPSEIPDDMQDYFKGINDWDMSHPGEDPPSYDDWKKSQDPDYEPDDGSVELPPEIIEALQGAAGASGTEPPYSIRIDGGTYPELFGKFEEATGHYTPFAPEVRDDPGFIKHDPDEPWHNIDPGFNPKGNDPEIVPQVMPITGRSEIKLPDGWQHMDIDPSAAPHMFPIGGPHEIAFTPETEITGPTAAMLDIEGNDKFVEALKGELDGVDLDEAFKPYIQDEGPHTGSLRDLVVDSSELVYASDGPDVPDPGPAPEEPEQDEPVFCGGEFGF